MHHSLASMHPSRYSLQEKYSPKGLDHSLLQRYVGVKKDRDARIRAQIAHNSGLMVAKSSEHPISSLPQRSELMRNEQARS